MDGNIYFHSISSKTEENICEEKKREKRKGDKGGVHFDVSIHRTKHQIEQIKREDGRGHLFRGKGNSF